MMSKPHTQVVLEEQAVADAPSPGSQLQQLRSAAGISREQLAVKLCISTKKLQLLESDQYERMPGAPYIRGYFRNACKVLEADVAPLLEAFEHSLPRAMRNQASMKIASGQQSPALPLRHRGLIFFGTTALLLAMAVGTWWSFNRDTPVEAKVSTSTHAQPEPPKRVSVDNQSMDAVFQPASPATDREVHQSADIALSPAIPEAVPDPATAIPGDEDASAIRLQFSQDAWVEVIDSEGTILLSRVQPAGSSVELSGAPPFQLMLGNAAATRVHYLGKEVETAPIDSQRTRKLLVGDS